MPKETPHRQTSPPASRGGYNNNYNDRGRAYSRGGGRNTGGYVSRGAGGGQGQQGYQGQMSYGGYRGGRQGQRGGYSQPPQQPVMNIPFGMSPLPLPYGNVQC